MVRLALFVILAAQAGGAPGQNATSSAERQASAARLLALPTLDASQRDALLALGRDAVPALLADALRSSGARYQATAEILAKLAQPEDTAALVAIVRRREDPKGPNAWGYPSDPWTLENWLMEKGEPAEMARTYLPLWKAGDANEKEHAFQYLQRSHDGATVDAFMEALRRTPKEARLDEGLYEAVVASERPEALEWIRSRRRTARRLATPVPRLSATADADGDGLPDAVDANPFAAPRRLTDAERMFAVAFEWQAHEYGRFGLPAVVTFPPGIKPFELFGWPCATIPKGREADAKLPPVKGTEEWPCVFIRFAVADPRSGSMIIGREPAAGTVVDYGISYGSLGGNGSRLTMRKIRGEWYVVRVESTWIA